MDTPGLAFWAAHEEHIDLIDSEKRDLLDRLAFFSSLEVACHVRKFELISVGPRDFGKVFEDGNEASIEKRKVAYRALVDQCLATLEMFSRLACATFEAVYLKEEHLQSISSVSCLYFSGCYLASGAQPKVLLSPSQVVFSNVRTVNSAQDVPLLYGCSLNPIEIASLSVLVATGSAPRYSDAYTDLFLQPYPKLQRLYFSGFWDDVAEASHIISQCPNVTDFGWCDSGYLRPVQNDITAQVLPPPRMKTFRTR
jgi:hypothetical protein